MKRITLDFETRSVCNLKKAGAFKYSLDPSTQPTCMAFKLREMKEPVLFQFKTINKKWEMQTVIVKSEWQRYINEKYLFIAQNAFFEQCIYNNVLVRRLGWPPIPAHLWRCTAAKAAACALPRSLEGAGEVLSLTTQKDKSGYAAMMLTCRPTKQWNAWKKKLDKCGGDLGMIGIQPSQFLEPHAAPQTWDTLYRYCKIDVLTEELLDKTLPDLSDDEQKIWFLNQKLNWRGVKVDVPTIQKIVDIMAIDSKKKLKELDHLTMGVVTKAGARQSILDFLDSENVKLSDIRAKTVDDALARDDLSNDARRLLELRKALSKTSTKKYQAFLDRANSDGRIRDILLYHGASTGRDTGTGIQPHNFPRGLIRVDKNRPYEAVENVKHHSYEELEFLYGDSLPIVFSAILRNMIVPSDGHELFVADFSKIEVAVLWWLADNRPGLQILRDGKDPYKYQAAANTNKNYEDIAEEGDDRQLGKAQTLGCLAQGTSVLTKDGFKLIEQITREDRVWDGQSWVNHGGVEAKGLKTVIQIESQNIKSTPDHWFHQNGMWQTAVEIVSQEDTLPHQSDLQTGMPLSLLWNLNAALNVVSKCAAYAELKKNYELITSTKAWVSCAQNVLRHLSPKNTVAGKEAEISLLIQGLENVGQLVSITSKKDVSTLVIKTSRGMAVAALPQPLSLLEIFWNSLLLCAGLINGGSRWTELIMTETMNPETYELLVTKLITETVETFDVINSGKHNCFQVNQILAHNCGFGMGSVKFRKTAYDLYRLVLTVAQARKAVKAYRDANPNVPMLWLGYENAAVAAVKHPSVAFFAGKCRFFFHGRFLHVELPSGRRLHYFKPRITKRVVKYEVEETVLDKDGNPKKDAKGNEVIRTTTKYTDPRDTLEFLGVDKTKRKMDWERTWGGTLTENIVQAVARDLMMTAAVNLEKGGYKMLLTVHDEAISETPIGQGSLEEFKNIMCTRPKWADEWLLIDAKAWRDKRYKK